MKLGDLNRRIQIQRPAPDLATDSAGSSAWERYADAWAQVLDVLPSRDERTANGVSTSSRRARIRMRYRTDINSGMRIVIGSRILQIVGGPSEVGNREWLELLAEEYSSAGNPA